METTLCLGKGHKTKRYLEPSNCLLALLLLWKFRKMDKKKTLLDHVYASTIHVLHILEVQRLLPFYSKHMVHKENDCWDQLLSASSRAVLYRLRRMKIQSWGRFKAMQREYVESREPWMFLLSRSDLSELCSLTALPFSSVQKWPWTNAPIWKKKFI